MENFSIIIASISLFISGLTAYLTLFRKGKIGMTKPTVIFFGTDVDGTQKIFLRTLLFSTSQKGQIIENMYIKIRRGESIQNFNIWGYSSRPVIRGGGLFVGKEGVAEYHHFHLPNDGTLYDFLPGIYTLEIYASKLNSRKPSLLCSVQLSLSQEHSEVLNDKSQDAGIFFDWGPDSQTYHSYIDFRPESNRFL